MVNKLFISIKFPVGNDNIFDLSIRISNITVHLVEEKTREGYLKERELHIVELK